MGPFIIGILVGWLAEWIFFTFFMKGKKQSGPSSHTSALQQELQAKNNEIKELQAKLADSRNTSSADSSSVSSSSDKPVSSTVTESSTSASTTTKNETAASTQKTTAKKPSTAPAKTTKAKPAAKKTTSTPKKPAAKTTPKVKTATKPAAKKPTPKKAPAKKPAAKTKAKPTGDDFTRLSGIGPSMASTLNELGIDSYKKLAAMDDDILRDMLEASGARLNNNKEAMDTWNEQATLADKGDFEGLKKMQESLKK